MKSDSTEKPNKEENIFLFYTQYYIISGVYHVVNVVNSILNYSANCSSGVKEYLHDNKVLLQKTIMKNTKKDEFDEDDYVVIKMRKVKNVDIIVNNNSADALDADADADADAVALDAGAVVAATIYNDATTNATNVVDVDDATTNATNVVDVDDATTNATNVVVDDATTNATNVVVDDATTNATNVVDATNVDVETMDAVACVIARMMKIVVASVADADN